jgi:hypothetical protein
LAAAGGGTYFFGYYFLGALILLFFMNFVITPYSNGSLSTGGTLFLSASASLFTAPF